MEQPSFESSFLYSGVSSFFPPKHVTPHIQSIQPAVRVQTTIMPPNKISIPSAEFLEAQAPSPFFQSHFADYRETAEQQRADLHEGHAAVDFLKEQALVGHDFVPSENEQKKAANAASKSLQTRPHFPIDGVLTGSEPIFRFPSVHSGILWDRTAQGTSIRIRPHRLIPKIFISRNIIESLQHRAIQWRKTDFHGVDLPCFLVCELRSDARSEGETDGMFGLHINRYDPGEPVSTASLVPDSEHMASTTSSSISHMELAPGAYTVDNVCIKTSLLSGEGSSRFMGSDYVAMIEEYLSRCARPCHTFALSDHFVLMSKVQLSDVSEDSYELSVVCEIIAPSLSLVMTPINPLRIVSTSLAQTLKTESRGQGQSGYITLDQSRRLVPLLQSDSKSLQLPIVGVWVSGADVVVNPLVQAVCLRYIHNNSLHGGTRLFMPSPRPSFLVLLLSKKQLSLFDCTVFNENANMNHVAFTHSQYQLKVPVSTGSIPKVSEIHVVSRSVDEFSDSELEFEESLKCFVGVTANYEGQSMKEPEVEKTEVLASTRITPVRPSLGSALRVKKRILDIPMGRKETMLERKTPVKVKENPLVKQPIRVTETPPKKPSKSDDENRVVLTKKEHDMLVHQSQQLKVLQEEVADLRAVLTASLKSTTTTVNAKENEEIEKLSWSSSSGSACALSDGSFEVVKENIFVEPATSPSYPHSHNAAVYGPDSSITHPMKIGEESTQDRGLIGSMESDSDDSVTEKKKHSEEAVTMLPVPSLEAVTFDLGCKTSTKKKIIGVSVLPPLPTKPLTKLPDDSVIVPAVKYTPTNEGETNLVVQSTNTNQCTKPELSFCSRKYLEKYGLLDDTLFEEEEEEEGILGQLQHKPLKQIRDIEST